jgi:hypothetical protein
VAIPVTGFATSIRNGSSWTTEVAIPDGTLNGLGAPRASFGNSTLIIGSGEEIAFRQQQQQHRDEGAQRLAQIEADRLAAEQLRIHEGRKELQRQKAQTQLALEREREATVAQARQEKAREEAERLDAERASREAAERDRVQRAAIPKEAAIVSGELRKGTEVSVRLSAAVSSATAKVEDRFDAVIVDDVMLKGQRLVPAGSQMRGVVSAAEPAGRVHRTGRMTLAFDQLTIAGRSYPIRARVTKALSGSGVRDAKKVGVGAGIGAVIGGILGGAKGALAGLAIGGGGTMAATEGSDVSLAPGAVLRVKLDAAVDIR